MFKNLIAPMQIWLLAQGRCVGCSMPLSKEVKKGDLLACKCGRVYKMEGKTYRRATVEEAKQ